jgi:O-antigen/teichoic acid export membrane protein
VALYLFVSGLLTIIYSIGTLQGTIGRTFGHSEDSDIAPDGLTGAAAVDKRRALATGLLLMTGLSAVGTLVIAYVAGWAADAAVGHGYGNAHTLMWAAAAGALAAVWRLATNVLRMERRPVPYVIVHSFRPACILAAQAVLLVTGHGLNGAVAGVALGDAVALLIAVLAIFGSWRFGFSWRDAKGILKWGLPIAPVMVSFWLIQNADLFLLSRYAGLREVGIYRVANAIAALMAYFVGAFSMAWGPLRHAPVFLAAERERGRRVVDAYIANYFVLATALVMLVLWDFAKLFIALAPHSYGGAASLIPMVALTYAAHSFFVLIYRTNEFHRKRPIFIVISVISNFTFVGMGFLLIPRIGAYGAALAPFLSFMLAAGAMYAVTRRKSSPPPYYWRSMTAGIALAGALGYAGHVCSALGGAAAWIGTLAAVAAYPAGLVTFRIIPTDQMRALVAVLRSTLPGMRARTELVARLGELPPADVAILRLATRERRAVESIARSEGLEVAAVYESLVGSMRQLCQLPSQASAVDRRLGALFVFKGPVAEWDEEARRLWPQGADPLEVDVMVEAWRRLRKLPSRRWPDETRIGTNSAGAGGLAAPTSAPSSEPGPI